MDLNRTMMTTVLALVLSATVFGGDWEKWRGPNGTGIVYDDEWNPHALNGSPRIVWEAKLGLGYSSVAVRDGRLYALGNKDIRAGNDTVGVDIIYCLDAGTGVEIWRYSYPCQTDNTWPGPTASPVLDGDRLYTVCDDTGDLFCLNALDGRVLWKRNVVADFGTVPPYNGVGYAGSPIIEGDLVLFNLNTAGIALNKYDGKTVWSSEPGRCSFSTPVVFDHRGERKVALFGAKNFFLLDPGTGRVLDSHPWETSSNENTADPIVDGDRIFISSAYGQGCALLRLEGDDLELVWQNHELNNQFTSSVFIDGYVYGIDGERPRCHLKCIDLETGEVMWRESMRFSSLIAVNERLVVLDEDGVLHVVEATPEAFREIAGGKVQRSDSAVRRTGRSRTHWWTNPVLVNGHLYVRSDKGDFACIDVSK